MLGLWDEFSKRVAGREHGRQTARRWRLLSQCRHRLFRGPRAQAPCGRLLSVGARRRRGHLRRFLWLESRLRRGRLGRHVPRHDHHHHHVSRPDLFHRRDESGAAAYRRSLLVRPHRLWAMGRVHHGRCRERRICADARRDRLLHRRLSYGDLRHAGRVPAGLVDSGLHRVCDAKRPRRRTILHSHRHRHAAGDRGPRHLLRQRDPVLRFRQIRHEYRRRSGDRRGNRTAGRPRSVPAVRRLRRAGLDAVCGVAVPRHRATATGGRRVGRS